MPAAGEADRTHDYHDHFEHRLILARLVNQISASGGWTVWRTTGTSPRRAQKLAPAREVLELHYVYNNRA